MRSPDRPRYVAIVAVTLASACTWINQADVDARTPELDDDDDGYTKSEDCNDDDGDISPDAVEIWYDGVDQDCAGDDDYDADKDGFVPDAYTGLATPGAAGSGLLPGGDCNDADPDARPGAVDAWYDGKDRDCAGDDDYDADGDGWVQTNHGGIETENVPGTGNLPEGDCSDSDAAVNPDMDDTWYDGIDSDCAGDDDWDQDADGWYDLDAHPEYDETLYAPGTGVARPGDCDDTDGDVNEGAIDEWYDGVDADCGGEDDFDQDADGYVPTDYEGLLTRYVDDSGSLPAGDCDDGDDTVHPGTVEIIGDEADQDCDGSNDGFSVGDIPGIDWVLPRAPRFSSNDAAFYLSVVSDEVTYGAKTYVQSAVALQYDIGAPEAASFDFIDWLSNLADPGYELSEGHDFFADDDFLYGAVSWSTSAGDRQLYISTYELGAPSPIEGKASQSGTYAPFEVVALAQDGDDTVLDDGFLPVPNLHAIGCESDDGVVTRVEVNPTDFSTNYLYDEIEGLEASSCAVQFDDDPYGAILTGGDGIATTVTTFDRTEGVPTYTADTTWAALEPNEIDTLADTDGTWVIAADSASSELVILSPSGDSSSVTGAVDPVSVQGNWSSDGEMFLCYTKPIGTAWFVSGHPDTGWSTPIEITTDFPATHCSVFPTPNGDHLAAVVTGADALAVAIADRL